MKKTIFLAMILCVSSFLFSFEYVMNSNPAGLSAYYSGTTHITALTGGDWDSGYYDLALPSANRFYYYGRLVTHLRISTNGYVCLGHGSPSGSESTIHTTIPSPNNADNFVAPLMNDYVLAGYASGAGAMYYGFGTNPGYDLVIVEWRGVRVDGSAHADYTFSCMFCSANHTNLPNMILFSYSDVDAGDAAHDFGVDSTVGIENSTGTVGELYSNNQAIVSNSMHLLFTPFVPVYGSTTDMWDLDGYPDVIVFRPSTGMWHNYCSDGTKGSIAWGQKGDIPLPGDYDGDGDSDNCVFRPGNNTWYGQVPDFTKIWGASGDIPVPADYDGDGYQDLAVFRSANGAWYIHYRGTATSATIFYGKEGDVPMPGDYDYDGKADVAVYRPSNSKWYVRKSSDGTTLSKTWGADGDIPLQTTLNTMYGMATVFRPSTGFFHAASLMDSTTYSQQWGQDGDVPTPADENVGGYSDVAVFRPSTNAHWFIYGAEYLPPSFIWGTLGDKPRYRCSNLIVSPPPNQKKDH